MKRNKPQQRGAEGQVIFGARLRGEPEFFGTGVESFCGASIASAILNEDVRVRAYVFEKGKWTPCGDEYIVSVTRRGKVRRNLGIRGRAALDAFLGSLAFVLLGFASGSALLRWLGSIGGGALGGYLGARRKGAGRKTRRAAATGGAIGGAFGPLPAGVGGYAGAEIAEGKKRNEDQLKRRVRR